MTLKATRKSIFSPALVAGRERSASQESPTISLAGRVHRRASRSVLPVNNSDNLTKGTSPLPLCGSLMSVALQSSLANKLRQRLGNTGSMIYSLSWKDKVTPAGRPYCQRVASVPHTKGTGSSLVPLTNWPTPTANNGTAAGTSCRQGGMNLQTATTIAAWPTPTASDYKGSGQAVIRKDGKNRTFNRLDYATEQGISQPVRITDSGQILTCSDAGMESSGQLNPAHSRWLMGYPPEWDACAVMAMPLSRK